MTLMFPKPKPTPRKAITEAERHYLRCIKRLSCALCGCIPCDAHHTICGRYSQSKTPHWHAIPLCDRHHQGLWDTRGPAIHKERTAWVDLAGGPDTQFIAETQDRIKAAFGIEVPAEFQATCP